MVDALHCGLSNSASGTPTLTADLAGRYELQLIVRDDHGHVSAADTVVITAGNRAPGAVDDAYAATTGQILLVPTPGVLANDSDPDGQRRPSRLRESLGLASLASWR